MTESIHVAVWARALADSDFEGVDAHAAHSREVRGFHLIGDGGSIADDDRHELVLETDELEDGHARVLPTARRKAASLG